MKMAIIKKFDYVYRKSIDLYRQTKLHRTDITIDERQGCIKIVTFGSENRENTGIPSQTLTFSREVLEELKYLTKDI